MYIYFLFDYLVLPNGLRAVVKTGCKQRCANMAGLPTGKHHGENYIYFTVIIRGKQRF